MEPATSYPVFDPGERVTVALFEGTVPDAKYLGRVKLQLSTMEDGVRYAPISTRVILERRVTKTCTLHVGLRFDYESALESMAKTCARRCRRSGTCNRSRTTSAIA